MQSNFRLLDAPLAVAVFVLFVTACWLATAQMAAAPGGGMDWQGADFAPLLLMWAVMMAAMMLPAAAAFLRLFWQGAKLHHQKQNAPPPAAATALALAGYLSAWGVFSAAAAGLQMAAAARLDAETLAFADPAIRAALFALAGAYQLSPLKFACLRGCRPAAVSLLLHWRRGAGGALLMGAHNGAYCLGCCWALMLLLFAGGIMNLWWIVGLSVYAFAEKTFPPAALVPLSRVSGVVLLAVAVWVLFG